MTMLAYLHPVLRFARLLLSAVLVAGLAPLVLGCASGDDLEVPEGENRWEVAYNQAFRESAELTPAMVNRLWDKIEDYHDLLDSPAQGNAQQAAAAQLSVRTMVEHYERALLAGLVEGEERERRLSAIALGFLRDPAKVEVVVPQLLGVLGDEDDPIGLTYFALNGFVELGRDSDALQNCSQRTEVLWAALTYIADANADLRMAAADALSGVMKPSDEEAIRAVVLKLAEEDVPEIRQVMVAALADLGTREAYEQIRLSGLSDPDANVRQDAVVCLGYSGDPRYVDALIGALQDADPRVRMQATVMLTRYRHDDELRSRIVRAVANRLRDRNGDVRALGARTLGELGDVTVVPELIAKLGDSRDKVRLNAISSLGLLRDDRAIDPLVQTMADREESIRRACQTALGYITGVDWGTEPTGWRNWLDQGRPPVDEEHYSHVPGAEAARRALYTNPEDDGFEMLSGLINPPEEPKDEDDTTPGSNDSATTATPSGGDNNDNPDEGFVPMPQD